MARASAPCARSPQRHACVGAVLDQHFVVSRNLLGQVGDQRVRAAAQAALVARRVDPRLDVQRDGRQRGREGGRQQGRRRGRAGAGSTGDKCSQRRVADGACMHCAALPGRALLRTRWVKWLSTLQPTS